LIFAYSFDAGHGEYGKSAEQLPWQTVDYAVRSVVASSVDLVQRVNLVPDVVFRQLVPTNISRHEHGSRGIHKITTNTKNGLKAGCMKAT